MTALLTARNISLAHAGHDILREVCLNIGEKDFITIIGPNGAGKTSLLKCVMGLITPDSGTIERQDGLKIGYVPQRFSADHSLPIRVKDFLTLRKRIDAVQLEPLAEETQITSLMGHMLYHLSGGEVQRVLLTRALLDFPDLLILDEPAQNLDISGQISFYRLLERLYDTRDIAILMVSHDLHLVMASSKQVICLFHHVCCSGEPHAVAKDPEFLSLFGDDMAKLMALYHHQHDHHHHHDSAEPCREEHAHD